MKKNMIILALWVIGLPAFGQANEELEFIRDIFQLEKAAMLSGYLDLPREKLDVLSPIYTAYEAERRAVGNRRISLLKQYAEQYGKLSDEQADALVKEFFEVQTSTLKLHRKYYKKVKKSLGSRTAFAFLQFEEYIENAIREAIWQDIPFVEAKK